MWSSFKRTAAQLLSDIKRDITEWTLSYFSQTGAAYDENTDAKFQQT